MNADAKKFSSRLALNLFIEFGPIILFFVVFSFFDFIIASLSMVVIVIITFIISVVIEKRIAIFPLFASGSIIVFGGATVLFSNPTYLIFKDTLFWGIFGLIILIYYMNNILILKKLFINIFDITEKGWRVVSIRWIVFAFILSISNQIALIHFTPDQWVIYKMCTLVALVLFSMLQFSSSRKHRNPTANPWGMKV